ncbi:hypothetical protein Tco_0938258 [Tanacetum coccineum]|uniref:Uncharacterized protein n=1 Tax=Tanacetum coccineum TaxID=301880 RepID=A0ABQ5DHL5_9ASTR
MPTEMELTLEQTQQGVSYEVSNIRVISFTMKMEILLEPTSNKLMVERFNTTAGNPVKKTLLRLNLSDHRSILTNSKEHLKMVMEISDSSWIWILDRTVHSQQFILIDLWLGFGFLELIDYEEDCLSPI